MNFSRVHKPRVSSKGQAALALIAVLKNAVLQNLKVVGLLQAETVGPSVSCAS